MRFAGDDGAKALGGSQKQAAAFVNARDLAFCRDVAVGIGNGNMLPHQGQPLLVGAAEGGESFTLPALIGIGEFTQKRRGHNVHRLTDESRVSR